MNPLNKPYIPYQQWPEYKPESETPNYFKPELVITNGLRGVRWHFGPLHLEEYVVDTEPVINSNCCNRIIFWQRIYNHDLPVGWHQGFFAKSPQRIGYAQIKQKEYWKDWPEKTRYYRRKWLKEYLDKKYSIELVSLKEYREAYLQSSVVKKVGLRQIEKLELKMDVAKEHINLWGIRRMYDGKIVAGLGTIDSLAYNSSNHLSAFMHQDVSDDRVSLGLIDHWFKDSEAKSITILDFGIFWQKGKPNSWKGFSEFKRQFGVIFINLPPRLFRIKLKRR